MRRLLIILSLLLATPALAVDWQQVDANDSSLWFDNDSFSWNDDDTFVYFRIYHGGATSAEWMTNNSVRLAVNCDDGQFHVWDTGTSQWQVSSYYPTTEALDDMAFYECWFF